MKKALQFIIIVLLCVGCKVQKPQTNDSQTNIPSQNEQNTFQTYTANISGSYNSIPFRGTLRLQKDSVLWVSVTGFGFEVARLLMTQDSVFAVNKVEKEAVIGDYTAFERHFGMSLTFSIVQKVLLDTTETHYQSSNQTDIRFIPQGKTLIENFIFPQQITAKAKFHNSNEEITIKFSNQQINIPISTPFSIPATYDTLK
ncbi:MAG: DUF4292 domain-containing protein [Bacteroidales bacterium]|jgi:hypothetical protein|nr:DUF4292 domain-containing protein [Bacteroidales bacterium]